MKICPICNSQVEDNAVFCNNCGTQFIANPQQPNYQMPPQPTPPPLILMITQQNLMQRMFLKTRLSLCSFI